MNYLILFILFFFVSCTSKKDKDLVDVSDYMNQGKEIFLVNKYSFKEIKKINALTMSKPVPIDNWLGVKLNSSNNLPRFLIKDFNKKSSINLNAKFFLNIKNNIFLIDSYANLIVLDDNFKELKRKSIYKKKDFRDYKLEFSMVSNGKLIFISDNLGNIHGIETDSLKIRWTLKLGVPIKSNLYLSKENLFFVNTNSKVYSVNSTDGQINWSYETASKISKENYQISIFYNFLLLNNDYGEIYCFDFEKKNILWKLNLQDKEYQFKLKYFKPTFLVIKDGILYFSSNFGEAYAIEVKTGKIIWSKLISATNLPIINNNYVFYLNRKGYLYILDRINGDILYSNDLNKLYNNKSKNKIYYNDLFLGLNYIYIINSENDFLKIDINNLSLIKIENFSTENISGYLVLKNHIYILENKKLSKFYNK